MMEISEDSLFQPVKEIIRQSREKVFRIANSTLLLTYGQIGKLIVENDYRLLSSQDDKNICQQIPAVSPKRRRIKTNHRSGQNSF